MGTLTEQPVEAEPAVVNPNPALPVAQTASTLHQAPNSALSMGQDAGIAEYPPTLAGL